MQALPVAEGFYNWKDFSEENILLIKEMMNRSFEDIDEEAEEMGWCWFDDWEEKTDEVKKMAMEVRKQLKNAPKLIPIYGHRYMPIVEGENIPIFSIYGIDLIYYGGNIEEYFEIEFGDKDQDTIDFENIRKIPFWSDIVS